MKWTFVLAMVSVLVAPGCGADAGTGGAASGSGGGASGSGCNDVANVGSPVPKTANAGPVPPMTGGTLADGTYVLTAIVDYTTAMPGTTSHTETWVLAGGKGQSVVDLSGQVEKRYAFTYSTSGTQLNLDIFCPSKTPHTLAFSATTTSFTFVHDDDMRQVSTYTKK